MTANATCDERSKNVSGAIIQRQNSECFDVFGCLAIEKRSAFAERAGGSFASEKTENPDRDSRKDKAKEKKGIFLSVIERQANSSSEDRD